MKDHVLLHIPYALIFTMSLIFLLFLPCSSASDQEPKPTKELLTKDERAWVSQHAGQIRLGVTEIPPQIIRGSVGNELKGLSVDYIRLMERNLGISFKVVYVKTWSELLQKAKSREIDVLFAAQKTPERSQYLIFTEPYIELPNMIFVRKNSPGKYDLKEMGGLKVATSRDSAVHSYLKSGYPALNIIPVEDEMSGLLKLSVGEVDAMVVEVSRASYLIDKVQLTNLRIAGDAGYKYELRFACRNDWAVLSDILNKGLASITQEEKDAILRRWVDIGSTSFFMSKEAGYILGGGILLVLSMLIGISAWNRTLRSQVSQHTQRINKELLERRKAEEQLRYSEEKYRLLIENQHDLVVKVNSEGRFLYVSPSYCKLFGKAEHELIGHAYIPLVHEDDRFATEQAVASLRHPPHTCHIEQRAMTAVGWRWLEWTDTAVLDETGNVVEIIGIGRDITVRKTAEETLRESEERFRTLVESAPEGIFVHSQGRFVFANPALARILGVDRPESIVGTDVMDRVAPEYHETVCDRIRHQAETGEPVPLMEQEYVRFDGSRVPVETTAVPVRYEGRKSNLVFVHDITERRRVREERNKLQEQLIQSQKMESVGRLAGGVAHDYNNMLAVIFISLELAKMKLPPESPVTEHLEEIEKAAMRSRDITRQLLAFSRRQPIAPKPTDLNVLIADLENSLARLIGEDIELRVSLPHGLGLVLIDPSQIDQILVNLAVNARDAMPHGGILTIETGHAELEDALYSEHFECSPGRYVLLKISDTGVGMDKETMQNIFEPFFTTKEVGKGTGLGLATVFGIVKQNNGFITVFSEVDGGTVFSIYLPRIIVEEIPENDSQGRRDSSGKREDIARGGR